MTSHVLGPGGPWPPAELGKAALRVVEALRAAGPSRRSALGAMTGQSRPTISAAITELLDRGLVESIEDKTADRGAGRPAELVRLHRNAGIAAGVEVGRRHVHVVLADLGHRVIHTEDATLEPEAHGCPGDVLDRAAELLRSSLAGLGIQLSEVVGVGLGIPAPITRGGAIGSTSLLPAWAGFAPGPEFSARLDGAAVFVDNDASLGALGEYMFGGGRGSRDMTYVKIATGIGAGTVRDGRLHRGAAGTAGELGHIPLDFINGSWCPCGSRGCVELYAGGDALLREIPEHRLDVRNLDDLVRSANEGDPLCRRLIAQAGDYLGIALGALVNLDGPDRIVVGGELSAANEILIDPVRQGLSRVAMAPAVEGVRVTQAELGNWASAWGGVALVLKAAAPDVRHKVLT